MGDREVSKNKIISNWEVLDIIVNLWRFKW